MRKDASVWADRFKYGEDGDSGSIDMCGMDNHRRCAFIVSVALTNIAHTLWITRLISHIHLPIHELDFS